MPLIAVNEHPMPQLPRLPDKGQCGVDNPFRNVFWDFGIKQVQNQTIIPPSYKVLWIIFRRGRPV